MLQPFAVFTYQERLAMFDRKQRNEKEAQIMVSSFQICLLQPARWAKPRDDINCFSFWLDTCYEEKHSFVARDSWLVSRI
jgi:hypothetical protein